MFHFDSCFKIKNFAIENKNKKIKKNTINEKTNFLKNGVVSVYKNCFKK